MATVEGPELRHEITLGYAANPGKDYASIGTRVYGNLTTAELEYIRWCWSKMVNEVQETLRRRSAIQSERDAHEEEAASSTATAREERTQTPA